MPRSSRPLVISAPHPRSIDLIFSPERRADLFDRYELVEVEPDAVAGLAPNLLNRARYVLGQPPLGLETLRQMPQLKSILNVESNLIDNMPYDYLFERGIHVLTTGAVFAEPVAELGLAMALDLARNVTDADLDFRNGREKWGYEGNTSARLISGAQIGIVGFGDLGRALARLLQGFRAQISAHDPWLPPSMLAEQGVQPADLDTLLGQSDFLFVVAAVTRENQGFLGADAFARMKKGAAFILLSRAEVVDFDALMQAVSQNRICAASDVFPEEPLPANHPVRSLKGFIRSAHRAGALTSAFQKMGEMVLEDMALMDQGLPPMRCKRAERETVSRMRSRPVTQN